MINFVIDLIPIFNGYDDSLEGETLLIMLGVLVFVLIICWLTVKGPLYFPDKDYGELKNYTLGYSKTDPINFEAIEGKTFSFGAKALVWLLAIIICIVPISEFIWALKEYLFF